MKTIQSILAFIALGALILGPSSAHAEELMIPEFEARPNGTVYGDDFYAVAFAYHSLFGLDSHSEVQGEFDRFVRVAIGTNSNPVSVRPFVDHEIHLEPGWVLILGWHSPTAGSEWMAYENLGAGRGWKRMNDRGAVFNKRDDWCGNDYRLGDYKLSNRIRRTGGDRFKFNFKRPVHPDVF